MKALGLSGRIKDIERGFYFKEVAMDTVQQEAQTLIETHLLKKQHSDLLGLNEREKYFLFWMRSKLLAHQETQKPFYCSEKQLAFLKDLILRLQNPKLMKEAKLKSLKAQITHLKRQLPQLKAQVKSAQSDLREALAEFKKLSGKSKKQRKKRSI